jgi:ABC-type multidrug transport system fused ATPase/permease subunit
VLDGGRIVQSGTYRQLIDQPGLFQELVKRQIA